MRRVMLSTLGLSGTGAQRLFKICADLRLVGEGIGRIARQNDVFHARLNRPDRLRMAVDLKTPLRHTVEYLLRVETADLAAYKHWHTDVLGVLPQVQSITTFVVMGSPKDERS